MNNNENDDKEKGMIQIAGFRGNEPEIWVESDEWFHPEIISENNEKSHDKQKLKMMEQQIEIWKHRAERLKTTYQCTWKVKGATIRFLYNNKMYQLYPSAIGVSQELFEHMAGEIEQDLRDAGCSFVRYEGTLD
ncbi:MAG: hypothetical protein IJA32_12505 [Lachnospiraceae bacterium]|nr:hypothetical protein [Lachnospiraceae bacterium]